MTVLKSLQFAAVPRGANSSPEQSRRNKLITRLDQQLKLARDPSYAPSRVRWLPDPSGIKQPVEIKRRINPWWRTDLAGQIVLTVRYGSKPLEFEKGKAAILIGPRDQLPPTIENLIKAVAEGELDQLLAGAQRGPRDVPRKKVAA